MTPSKNYVRINLRKERIMPSVDVNSETYFQICFKTAMSLLDDEQKGRYYAIVEKRLDDHFKNAK
jgi:hypothetical protein|tara:strand:- start:395 stop:589 length:195 start_codon:yes stop_codon:yes gene_type:complete